jgi:nitrile hydratase
LTPRFRQGERVRIATRFPPGHARTPVYVRGKVGQIERVLDEFQNPELEAYGVNEGHPTRLYRVRIPMRTLWTDYGGAAGDSLDLEVFEHWLEVP